MADTKLKRKFRKFFRFEGLITHEQIIELLNTLKNKETKIIQVKITAHYQYKPYEGKGDDCTVIVGWVYLKYRKKAWKKLKKNQIPTL